MRLGISPYGHTRAGSFAVADAARDAGIDTFWLGEGLLEVDAFPRWSGGMEPFTWLAYLAGRSPGIRVGLGATILPLRDVHWLAKHATTLDHLTEGNVVLVATPGFWEREFVYRGLDYHRRGRLFDEALGGLRAAFTGEPYESATVRLPAEGRLSPAPYTDGGPTLWLAGGRPTLERALRLGLGFQARRSDPAELAPTAREWFDRGGGTLAVRVPIEYAPEVPPAQPESEVGGRLVGPASFLAEQIAGYQALGVHDLSIFPGHQDDTSLRTVEVLATEVLPQLAGIVE
jgi:alkanesulfonate monooxygenase SsuD/methylene tetrahydromethanopterin reductase-like flavin-dependent oxidoreductase (luciferase family)